MAHRHSSSALLCLTILLVLVIGSANVSVTVHAGSPDLTVDSIWLEDASQVGQPVSQVSPGQSFNIVAAIKNIGQSTASGYYLDVYYDSDYGRGGPDNIAAGEVQTWYVGPLTAQAGTHTTKWVVDPDNQIAELNESNNQKELAFTVGSQTTTTTVTVTTSSSSPSQTTTTTTTSSTTSSTLSSTTSSASASTSSTTQSTSTSTSLPVTHALGWLPENIPKEARVTPVVSAALPTHFDWTQKDGQNWMTTVKNQGGCGSCVSFAAVGALEGQLKIQANNPSRNTDLSEQHLFSCGGGTCSGGWYISSALNYLQQYGTPDEACSPYQGLSGSSSCSNSCPDWQSRASKISSWNWVANNPSALESALMNGPLVAGFTVYADFYNGYHSGVYHWDHTSQAVGGHAVVIVGYDQPGQYWIVKNSWGAGWGENGYFRIGFGEADIENYVASIKVSASPPPPPTNQPPTVSALSPDKASPQVVGTKIVWASSASDPEGDSLVYRFWLQSGTGAWVVTQDWSSASTWSWTPTAAGTYNVGVWVRDGRHAGQTGYDARLIVNGYGVASPPPNRPPTVSSLSPDKASPQVVGTTITWMSSASDPEGDSLVYRFWLQSGTGAWVVTQDWSSASTWAWTPTVAGTYNVGVWVRDGKHASSTGSDARLIVNGYSITSAPANRPPTVSALAPDKVSPQAVGTAVTWTCSATDPEGDPIQYRFWLQSGSGVWVITQDWSASNVWTWTPTLGATYNVGCWVRDGKHAGQTGYDARLIANGYGVASPPPNRPPTVSSLTSGKISPQVVGTTIVWTCSASDLEGDPIFYRFWVQAGTGAWVVSQDWSSSSTWSWTPSAAGTYNVGCWVRDGKHAGPTGFDDRKIVYGYVVTMASASIQPPSSVFLSPSLGSLSMDGRTYHPKISGVI